MLDNSDSTHLVIAVEFVDRLVEIADELPNLRLVVVVGGAAPTGLPFEAVDAEAFLAGLAERDFEGPVYRDIAAILYTSGTTAPPRGCSSRGR